MPYAVLCVSELQRILSGVPRTRIVMYRRVCGCKVKAAGRQVSKPMATSRLTAAEAEVKAVRHLERHVYIRVVFLYVDIAVQPQINQAMSSTSTTV